MSLPNLTELSRLLSLCRKQGVKAIRVGELEITLNDTAPQPKRRKSRKTAEASTEQDPIETDELSLEQRLFWSSTPGGLPVDPGSDA